MKELELSGTVNGNKTVGQFLEKLNIHLLYDPAILFLGIYSREMKTLKDTNINVHSSCIWKQPKTNKKENRKSTNVYPQMTG